jgi:ATP-binding cassette subfamily F protein 3
MADTPVANLSGGEGGLLLASRPDGPHSSLDEPPTTRHRQPRRADRGHQRLFWRRDMVSHDRYLLEACADRLWLVANGEVGRSTAI